MGNVVILLSGEKVPILKTAEEDQIREVEKSFLQQQVGLLEVGNDIMICFEANQTEIDAPTLFLLNENGETELSLGGDLVFLSGELTEGSDLNLSCLSLEQENELESSLFLEHVQADGEHGCYFLLEPKSFEGYSMIAGYHTIECDDWQPNIKE